jgi:hypothetical protein
VAPRSDGVNSRSGGIILRRGAAAPWRAFSASASGATLSGEAQPPDGLATNEDSSWVMIARPAQAPRATSTEML